MNEFTNKAQFMGKIETPVKVFQKNGTSGMWFSLRSGTGYISVLCYAKWLNEQLKQYIHEYNKGKRVIVMGEILFPAEASKAILLKLQDIKMVDELIDISEAAKRKANEIDFSND